MIQVKDLAKQGLGLGLFLLGVLVLFSLIKIQISDSDNLSSSASLTLNFDGGSQRKFEGPIIEGMTILEALQSSAQGGGFRVTYTLDQSGNVILESIADKSDMVIGKAWHFYLNNKPVRTGDIGKTIIKKHDLIEARYE